MNCQRIDTDIAIIGAGPAGLAAATAARTCGARVHLIDAFGSAGGQYYMQPAHGDGHLSSQVSRGREVIAKAQQAGVEFLGDCEVFAAYPGFRLFASRPQGPVSIGCRSVIVATGAHDRTMAFPGWTLPGVLTAGAGQRLAKVNGVLPGKRIVVAGSGIFLFAVAEALIGKGARIAALVEVRRPTIQLGLLMLRYPERWMEAWRLVQRVTREVERIVYGKIVAEAHGRDLLEGLLITAPDGSAIEEIADIDALLTSYGFQPSIDITSILGCSHRFDDALGGWFVDADYSTGMTSVPGIYAAGEVLGIAGAKPASLSGTLAGLSSASGLGFAVDQLEINCILPRLRRARRFGHGLGRLYAPMPSIADLARDDTVLCRCEEVSLREIREACAEGARSAYGSKIWTRAGMGRCQGRICRMSITQAIAKQTGRTIEEIGFNKPRIPVRPTPLDDVLAALADEIG